MISGCIGQVYSVESAAGAAWGRRATIVNGIAPAGADKYRFGSAENFARQPFEQKKYVFPSNSNEPAFRSMPMCR